MRYSYGILDQKQILLYHPQLFLRNNDVLIFPTREFHKWHGDIKEYLDGLYQIQLRSGTVKKPLSLDMNDFNLANAVLNNITDEVKDIFDENNILNLSHHYVSTLDEKYKKMVGNNYTTDMKRCDTKILLKPRITPWMKEKHVLEIVDQVSSDVVKIKKNEKLFE
ncbi:hypothetical protein Metbo_1578 [Methanobacterium lacus]|uniref:Uncharacterized protein n=1 Tax=Methanobacterium lacus (strain AL-21) TaxID=877455 RepID=F0T8X7_METLA|nr:hypothetical protein [Methanobacterium lacus]ADZ09805.1 hypothetical protein Metbo_1578 [Methanobacterium lacus]